MSARERERPARESPAWLRAGWIAAVAAAVAVRLWNTVEGPLLAGWDDFGHVAYVLYLDLYRAVPWADQGWSFFHPPLHYLVGWALAQARSADVLVHGLALWNGLASLGIAGLAAWIVRLCSPSRRGLALLAFVSVGFLPVYLYTSTMAGNELTAAGLALLGFALVVSNECRARPSLRRDAAAGLALGLALLAKVSAVLVLAAALTALALTAWRARRGSWRVHCTRGCVLGAIAIAVASPYYARNVLAFGTPLRMSRTHPEVAALEARQLPGARTWRDLFYVPASLVADPHPEATALLHSIWGSAYVQTWADPRPRKVFTFQPKRAQPWERSARELAVLGLAPTLLALAGGVLALRDVARGRRVPGYVPLLACTVIQLAAFAWFAFDAPQYSALKPSYLLGLTLPYAAFLARAVEALGRRSLQGIAAGAVSLAAAGGAVASCNGLVLPALRDSASASLLRFHLGEREAARRAFTRLIAFPEEAQRSVWIDNLADAELADGDAESAREHYLETPPESGATAYRWNAIGVATALTGRRLPALADLTEAIDAGAVAVGSSNRGAVHAALGHLAEAESDLRRALEVDDALAPAWHNLAEVLARLGREAADARARAAAAAQTPPRGYPYGIPHGLGQGPSLRLAPRWLLWLDEGRLRLAHAPYRPEDAQVVAPSRAAARAHPDVVLILIDALRADHLGGYGYSRPTSPHIDALAREGVRFAHASAVSSWTLPSVASLFTSRPPEAHGANAAGAKIRRGIPRVAQLLRGAGYRTVGVSGNFVHITRAAGFARGFEQWRTLYVFSADADGDPLLGDQGRDRALAQRAPTADEVNDAVWQLLSDREGDPADAPLFLFVHYMEPHSGYDPPEPQRSTFVTDGAAHAAGPPATSDYVTALARGERTASPTEQQRLLDLYDAEIATVDEAVGELLRGLAERGYADAVVILVADHGEEFSDHGGWFHGQTLYAESLAVPLIVRDPRRSDAGRVRSEPVDLLDVAPTVLKLAAVAPAPQMRGRDLLAETLEPRDVVARLDPDPEVERFLAPRVQRRAVIQWPWKILVDRAGAARVYQVERDPREHAPYAPDDPAVPVSVREAALRIGEAVAGGADPAPAPLTPDERERLRALGYVE